MHLKSLALTFAFALTAGCLFSACSSSSSGADGSNGTGTGNCAAPGTEGSNAACNSCVSSSCSSNFQSFCSNNCSANSQSSECMSTTLSLTECVIMSCSSPCGINVPIGAGGSGGSGGSGDTGGGGQAGLIPFACDLSASVGLCPISQIAPAAQADEAQSCMAGGGTPATTCPTANIIGCCTTSDGEQCGYTNAMNYTTQAACVGNGGTWTTTP